MLGDFGTGFSSLSHLQLFPFDFVKIDRPFVNRAGTDIANTGMTSALVQMAHGLNLTAIADLIETEEASKSFLALRCQYGQGYRASEATYPRCLEHEAWEFVVPSSKPSKNTTPAAKPDRAPISWRLSDPSPAKNPSGRPYGRE
jgi:EAL domain-containing protein (putative c-di-GMP-specific phosphodiesterase class I)